ncbi:MULTISPECIES: hypothetical protein [unclassified Tolypothrix]|nr:MULTISPECIES: hypothetical protein [unclassified Tolypothrix]BAY95458.1 hypothetical protein NIES3275_75150 [Microchaete diplosiphon NIES-3275]EKF00704.1 hypothetical protein FDUTEX481_08853 [Tolypothrix sp. PCC 7601]MBE9084596.1 hypothetical protein [Tolypothrix sp. LEGE 11397]UYD28637.1 hypothetical protein HGR01_11745 [Tolypothrix sp. PCC 7712]UYD35450.1 hypothetical protein HG267_06620 [Tolypothrix sp. PCC 7601]
MSAKKLSPEQIERLKDIEKQLNDLKRRSDERLALLENLSVNKLYCN